MKRYSTLSVALYCLFLSLSSLPISAQAPGNTTQATRGWLTVETIMRDPAWIGIAPSSPFWSEDGERLYFTWRREGDAGDSLYVSIRGGTPRRATLDERKALTSQSGDYSKDFAKKVFSRNGDIFLLDIKRGSEAQLTNTLASEFNPRFLANEQSIAFEREGNIFIRELGSGLERQVTNIRSGAKAPDASKTELQKTIEKQQLELFDVLRKRKNDRDAAKKYQELLEQKKPKVFYTGQKNAFALSISPDARFVTFILSQSAQDAKRTIVPNFVTESGFTEDIPARTKVGEPQAKFELYVYDVVRDTTLQVKPDSLEGLIPTKAPGDTSKIKLQARSVFYTSPSWAEEGHRAVVQIFSQDNKDRWIVVLNPEKVQFTTLLDHQRDSAWIGGPGISAFGSADGSIGWMPDGKRIWFQSEADGWSHLYVIGADSATKTNRVQLTKGHFEVYEPFISRDKKRWYFHSNEVHFGERHLYSMPLEGGTPTRITTKEGRNDVLISPDEKQLAVLHSFSNKPPELFLMPNKANADGSAETKQITQSLSPEFSRYAWRAPEVLTFKARDGANVPARVYTPDASRSNGAAVVFVHGAGYLQNAHKWWSTYFREYMFHNLLVDKGYTVLDVDYRASAGLGRNWRTGIYRFMGGKDLDDQVDGAKFLVEKYGVDAKRIGIYGGSYGGFITFMAMFTQPGVFAAGAALRPVTDWAHYNHGYTSAILNIPQDDSVAYRRSSPIYHAAGLQGALLICHGMVDVNVHYQDAVRLVQRLIELKKENWEFASYPVEDHGFREPTSWMDEYKRILKLFDSNLQKK
ncbi:MAG: S9 family peptidase [Ignavibacteria bacterium]|nr:S9 family peptidase [Ignavibacteria bacterium]